MPEYVVQRVADALNSQRSVNGSRVLVLGVAYKRTSTTCASRRRSTSSSCSQRRGAEVSYTDPYVPE